MVSYGGVRYVQVWQGVAVKVRCGRVRYGTVRLGTEDYGVIRRSGSGTVG